MVGATSAGKSVAGAYNLGHGVGSSVLEVVRACEEVSGRSAAMQMGPRREGDPAELIARVERATSVLGWSARHDLHSMVESAWRFHQRQ